MQAERMKGGEFSACARGVIGKSLIIFIKL